MHQFLGLPVAFGHHNCEPLAPYSRDKFGKFAKKCLGWDSESLKVPKLDPKINNSKKNSEKSCSF